MSGKIKLQLEYIINCSPKVLFNRLSTAAGLTEWFADDVRVKGNLFTFVWGDTNQVAEKKNHKENKSVRYEWTDDDGDKDEAYFEFVIALDDLTNDVSLMIVDFADQDEVKETTDLWNTQIAKLKQLLGS
ncbi:MAG: SRPBCC domain-containing protein [Prolixibacteraceae bacterium]|nr:SRPBCC domain-containing protein [Prolixibacteraceae bacterium]